MLLASHKDFPEESLAGWDGPALSRFGWLFARRLARGLGVRVRLGRCHGFVLCESGVKLYHPGYITAGRRLNLEDGCEIVGLSKTGVVFGDRCTVGRLATIRPSNVLLDEPGEGLSVGDNSNIGAYSFIGCSGHIRIGNNVLMGPHVCLLAENHRISDPHAPMKHQGVERSFILIEDDCWIGARATVLAGVTIRRGSIVAAGAVVTRDVDPFTVVGGVPARVITTRPSPSSAEAAR
jgi:acetyltransferase-like isoleucine patch superfamily enzyme